MPPSDWFIGKESADLHAENSTKSASVDGSYGRSSLHFRDEHPDLNVGCSFHFHYRVQRLSGFEAAMPLGMGSQLKTGSSGFESGCLLHSAEMSNLSLNEPAHPQSAKKIFH